MVHKNRTVITLISDKETNTIINELKKEEYLCNLLQYCKYTAINGDKEKDSFHKESYIEIEFEIVKKGLITEEPSDSDCLQITEEMVRAYIAAKKLEEFFTIDTRMAVYASRAYNLGDTINNVPYEGIFSVKRYIQALNKFQYRLIEENNDNDHMRLIKKECKDNLTSIKERLSNLFCSDCFETRAKEIELFTETLEKKEKMTRDNIWEAANQALSLSEHSRWIVEKLIMGYRPWSNKERLEYESHFGQQRKDFAKQMKSKSSDPAHIDLCSYRDLRRIDPDNMKYDSFLMQAIPLIFDKTRKADN